DETGFIIEPRLQKVIAKKEARQVHQVSYGSSHEHISVCPTISAPAELPFAILKKAYDKECERFRTNNNDKVVTKYTFTELLGPSYIAAYMPTTICNAFKTTEIWSLNPSAIGPDRLDPSLQELETLNNPGTSPLWKILKYLLCPNLPTEDLEDDKEQSRAQPPKRKKRKTMPFSRLLTNEESLKQLKEAEEEAERMVNEKQCKKEVAIQKRTAREAEKAQKQEARRKKKKNMECIGVKK
ncbi:24498_t:CDS:2, partial [Cetraspora pellucida]